MDYSSLSKLLSCPRLYEHSDIEKLAPSEERASARFGHAWHGILYQYGKDPVSVNADWIKGYLERTGWKDEVGDYRTAAKLVRGFQRYLERYAETPFSYVQQEKSFKMDITPGIEPWEGRKDAVVIWDSGEGRGPEMWVVDYKTTSRLQGNWIELYRNSNQFKGYFMDAKKEWPELAGVVVDVYHATKGAKSGKTFNDIEGNHFYRLPIRYEQFQLDEAKRDFAVGVTSARMYRELGYYPKNTSACNQFGTTCPFIELCEASSEEVRTRLRATYGVNTFDPHAPIEV